MRVRTKNRLLWIVGLVLLAVAARWGWSHRHDWVRRNFREVEAGKVYAGGYQRPRPLAEIVRAYRIRSVLCLRRDHATDPEMAEKARYEEEERSVLEAEGVRFKRVEVSFSESLPLSEQLDRVKEAADFLADPANQPVYLHCWAGKHRTGAVLAVYRVRHCGWTPEQARAELRRYGGMTQDGPPTLFDAYCDRFYRSSDEQIARQPEKTRQR